MTLTGTDPVTDIPGVSKSTVKQMDGAILVRDFLLSEQVNHRLPSKTRDAAYAIRTADIDPFDDYGPREIMLAKFRCAHGARFFDETGKTCSLHDAAFASPSPCWGVLGDRSGTPLPSDDTLTVTPNALIPAHYRTPGDRHNAVYLVTTDPTVSDPNGHVQTPASTTAHTDTIIPARELDLILDIFGATHGDMLSAMSYEQDSPLLIRDPDTGVEAMLPTATCPNRSDQALQWPQTDHGDAETIIYTLPLE